MEEVEQGKNLMTEDEFNEAQRKIEKKYFGDFIDSENQE
jgi:hypothetical protein